MSIPWAERHDVVVVGAGPAGLTAAWALTRTGATPLVLEADGVVGGLARTETYRGCRFDLGGHRFYTKVPEVRRLWEHVLGVDFLTVSRLSRILYRGRFYDYPLELWNVLGNLGVVESVRVLGSYLRARARRMRPEETFEQWVVNRFGRRLYRTFFQTYTEKVWGIPCERISADWGAQRIRELSLGRALAHAVFGTNGATSLISEFQYPRLGPGMMWERFRERIEDAGGRVELGTTVARVRHDGRSVRSVTTVAGNATAEIATDHLISSMALGDLITRLDPPAPAAVVTAARGLAYRALVVVGLVVQRRDVFSDQWIYVHSPNVRVGRIQNFKNWSEAMVADPETTGVGLEYFCVEGDALWAMADPALIALATRDLAALGLADPAEITDGVVFRQPRAYPVYDEDYRERVAVIRAFLAGLQNLQTIGRNGLHRYNNQDHSMLTGLLAAENVYGAGHDVWNVNVDRSYHEEIARGSRRLRARRRGALSELASDDELRAT